MTFRHSTDAHWRRWVAKLIDSTSPDYIGGGGSSLEVEDEGISLTTAATKLNFVGSGVTATEPVADEVTITVAAGGAPVDTVNGQTGTVVLDADDISDTSTTNKYTTAAEITKLSGIEALADVTDTTNVTAAGALMDSEVDADIKTLVLPASTTISTFGASLIDDAAASNARTTLDVDQAGTDNSDDNAVNTTYANDYRAANFVSGTDYEPAKGVDDNFVTDAEKIVIGNTSGANTGDQTIPVSGVDFDPVGTDNSTDVTLAGTGTYLSLVGQAITVDPITESDISDLGAYITGYTVTEGDVTAHEAAINHDALANFTTTEHFTQAAISIPASQISDFDTEVSNNASVTANTAKVTNATHTGDVAGSGALTIQPGVVDVAMLSNGTDGELITWSAAGAATTVPVGTATHVLTSNGAGAAPTFQAAAGGSVDLKPYIVSDTTGGQTMNSNTPFTVNLDNEEISDANYSLATDVITVSAAGTYMISFACTIDTTTNVTTARDGWESYIEYDSTGAGSSYVRVNQLSAAEYWREAADLNTSGTCSFLVIAAGGLLRLRAQHTTTATAAFPLVADRTHVSIIKLE